MKVVVKGKIIMGLWKSDLETTEI